MSGVGDDLYTEAQAPSSASSGPGLTKHLRTEKTYGSGLPIYDVRKYKYDVIGGRGGKKIDWHVSKADRMDAATAGRTLQRIYHIWNLEKENPEVLLSFTNALFFCHTMNSGSMIQPDRSIIYVGAQEFSFYEVVRLLGDDLRRFFRAFADDIAAVNQSVIDTYDPSDVQSRERFDWLMEVATDRGLMKYPHLAHDSSDKCQSITPAERAAVANSKIGIFSNISNAVDRLDTNSRMPTSDEFDSTNLRTVNTKAANLGRR